MISTGPEIIEKLLAAIMSALSAWTLYTNRQNRRTGKERDKVVKEAAESHSYGLREIGSQVGALAIQIQAREVRSAITDAKVDNLEKDVSRLQGQLDRLMDVVRAR